MSLHFLLLTRRLHGLSYSNLVLIYEQSGSSFICPLFFRFRSRYLLFVFSHASQGKTCIDSFENHRFSQTRIFVEQHSRSQWMPRTKRARKEVASFIIYIRILNISAAVLSIFLYRLWWCSYWLSLWCNISRYFFIVNSPKFHCISNLTRCKITTICIIFISGSIMYSLQDLLPKDCSRRKSSQWMRQGWNVWQEQ